MATDGVRALNLPQDIAVAVDGQSIPRIVRRADVDLRVTEVSEVWRVEDGWWREPDFQVRRLYFEVVLEDGALLTLFHDLLRGSWHAQRA
jgi:hypothetical protein